MRTYVDKEKLSDDPAADQRLAKRKTRQTPSCNAPLTKAAYEWDHALKIAADRVSGDHAPLHDVKDLKHEWVSWDSHELSMACLCCGLVIAKDTPEWNKNKDKVCPSRQPAD